MRFRNLGETLFIAFASCWVLTLVEAQTNLVANPGAETLSEDGHAPASWPVRVRPNTHFSVDRQEKRSGDASLSAVALEGASGKNFESLGSVQVDFQPTSSEARPGEIFEYGFWYKSKGQASVYAQSYLKGPKGYNAQDGSEYVVCSVGADAKDATEWKSLRGTYVVPAKTERLQSLNIGAWLGSPGAQVWIDDVVLRRKAALVVREIPAPPVLDGKLDDACWRDCPVGALAPDAAGAAAGPLTTFMAVRNAANLYLGIRCAEPRMAQVRAEKGTGSNGNICNADRVEIFIGTAAGKSDFYQFCFNTLGDKYDGTHKESVGKSAWKLAIEKSEDFWSAEASIPLAEVAMGKLSEFDTRPFNLIRGRMVGDMSGPDYYAWSATNLAFGNTDAYGVLVFGDVQQYLRQASMIRMQILLGREEFNQFDPHLFGRVVVQSTSPDLDKNNFQYTVLPKGSDKPAMAREHLPLVNGRIDLLEDIANLADGEYALRIFATNPKGEAVADARVDFRRTGGRRAKAVSRARMPLTTWAAAKSMPWHFTSAVAFPRGAVTDAGNVRLLDAQGKETPAAFAVLERWGPTPRDFIRWMRIEFAADAQEGKGGRYSIEYGTQVRRAPVARPVEVKETADSIEVNAGRLSFTVRKRGANFLDRVVLDGQTVLSGTAKSGPFMVDQRQREYRASLDPAPEIVVHERNALRAVLRITGRHYPIQAEQAEKSDRWPAVLGKYHTYIVAYANQPFVRVYHTFVITEDTAQVRYRDIGLRIPVGGNAAAFGVQGEVIELPAAENPYLLQRDMDSVSVYTLSKEGLKTEQVRKQRSEGWVTVGTTGLVVRDLWQNYPKELEVVPGAAQPELVIHFWPRHGEKVADRTLTKNNVGLLWFCHEGEELNFTPPKDYVNFVPSSQSAEWSLATSPGANAMGLAKTHEFLLVFGKAAAKSKMGDMATLYQQDPHAMQSPESLCASGAFGRIHPYDPKRFPFEEDSIRGPFDFIMRTADRLRDYGMFNFGDLHDALQYGNAEAYEMHRHWKGAQHNGMRMPWTLYARSGDPMYLTMARRHDQHVMDVDTVHYVDERFAAVKAVTGETFTHFLHWLGGAGPAYFEANLENKLWWHYFTGHPRGLDTAREWVEAIIAKPSPSTGREGSGTLAGIVEAYEATWDPRLLEPMDGVKRAQFSIEPWDGHWQAYAPSLEKYNLLTRSRESADRMVRWARRGGEPYDSDHRICSHAYWLTGDASLLQTPLTQAHSRGLSVYHQPGSKLDGYGGYGQTLGYTYYMDGVAHLLAAVADAGAKAPKPNWRRWQSNVISTQGLGAFHFIKDAGRPVTVECEQTYVSSKGLLIGPDGKTIKEYVFGKEKIALPAEAAPGEYRIQFTDPGDWRGMLVTTDAPKAVFRATDGWGFLSGVDAMYFWVPKDTASFRVGFLTHKVAGVGRIFDPEGMEAGVIYYPQMQTAQLTIKPKPEQTGKLWRLFMSGGDNSNHFTLTGVPPFVCGDPDRFFLPKN